MRAHHATLSALLVAFLAAPAAGQATYDLVDYFMLQPGQWQVFEERPPGGTQLGLFAEVVTSAGQYTLVHEYINTGGVWVAGDVEYYQITQDHLLYYGVVHPVTGDYEWFEPPIAIPRQVRVGDAFHHQGPLQTHAGPALVSWSLLIAADNVTKQTAAGTFTGCLRLQSAFLTDQENASDIATHAQGYGQVWSLNNDIDETQPEAQMAGAYIQERLQGSP